MNEEIEIIKLYSNNQIKPNMSLKVTIASLLTVLCFAAATAANSESEFPVELLCAQKGCKDFVKSCSAIQSVNETRIEEELELQQSAVECTNVLLSGDPNNIYYRTLLSPVEKILYESLVTAMKKWANTYKLHEFTGQEFSAYSTISAPLRIRWLSKTRSRRLDFNLKVLAQFMRLYYDPVEFEPLRDQELATKMINEACAESVDKIRPIVHLLIMTTYITDNEVFYMSLVEDHEELTKLVTLYEFCQRN